MYTKRTSKNQKKIAGFYFQNTVLKYMCENNEMLKKKKHNKTLH